MALLDSDDEWLPDHLAACGARGHVIVGSSALRCGAPGEGRSIGPVARGPVLAARQLLQPGNVLVTAPYAAPRRRDGRRAVRRGVVRSADLDLWLRVLGHGNGYVSPHVSVRYHRHPGQVTDDLTKTFDAYSAIVEAYRARGGLSRSDCAASEARVLWDRSRLDFRLGRRRAALANLARLLRDPRMLPGLADLLGHRLALRRRRRSYTRSGARTVRVWTANPELLDAARQSALPALEPLRPRGVLAGLGSALQHPAGVTVTDSRVRELLARVGGSEAIRVRDGDAQALKRLVP